MVVSCQRKTGPTIGGCVSSGIELKGIEPADSDVVAEEQPGHGLVTSTA
jgi:hypothetical protein